MARRDPLVRHLGIAFVFALLLYLVAYWAIESRRTRAGGWQVTFQTDAVGVPSLEVSQANLKIRNVRLSFPGQTAAPPALNQTIVFDRPKTNLPFGSVVYMDTTFLPGAIVFGMFGHEVQLAPRVLSVDQRVFDWKSVAAMQIPEKGRSPTPLPPMP